MDVLISIDTKALNSKSCSGRSPIVAALRVKDHKTTQRKPGGSLATIDLNRFAFASLQCI